MSNFSPDEFEELINVIRASIDNYTNCDNTKPIESNLNTKGMMFNSIGIPSMDGTIIVGENNGYIVVDVSLANGQVISFSLKDGNDLEGIKRVTEWFKNNYM